MDTKQQVDFPSLPDRPGASTTFVHPSPAWLAAALVRGGGWESTGLETVPVRASDWLGAER